MTQKEKAIELLQVLDPCYADKFINEGEIFVFDLLVGEKVSDYSELQQKIKQFEKRTGCLVWAVTHECLSFGECYSMLVVSKYKEDWDQLLNPIRQEGCYSAFAYVWNKTDEECSEFGHVLIDVAFGGIVRIG